MTPEHMLDDISLVIAHNRWKSKQDKIMQKLVIKYEYGVINYNNKLQRDTNACFLIPKSNKAFRKFQYITFTVVAWRSHYSAVSLALMYADTEGCWTKCTIVRRLSVSSTYNLWSVISLNERLHECDQGSGQREGHACLNHRVSFGNCVFCWWYMAMHLRISNKHWHTTQKYIRTSEKSSLRHDWQYHACYKD